jgi:hypothetical protein
LEVVDDLGCCGDDGKEHGRREDERALHDGSPKGFAARDRAPECLGEAFHFASTAVFGA